MVFNEFLTLFSDVCEEQEQLKKIVHTLDEKLSSLNVLLSENDASELNERFASYFERKHKLAVEAESLSVDLSGCLDELYDKMSKAILGESLPTVNAYLCLTSDSENVKCELEASKHKLIGLMYNGGLDLAELDAHASAARYASSDADSELPDEVFDKIQKIIGTSIARAIDRGRVFSDPSIDVKAYLNDSPETAVPLDENETKEESKTEPESVNNEVKTQETVAEEQSVPLATENVNTAVSDSDDTVSTYVNPSVLPSEATASVSKPSKTVSSHGKKIDKDLMMLPGMEKYLASVRPETPVTEKPASSAVLPVVLAAVEDDEDDEEEHSFMDDIMDESDTDGIVTFLGYCNIPFNICYDAIPKEYGSIIRNLRVRALHNTRAEGFRPMQLKRLLEQNGSDFAGCLYKLNSHVFIPEADTDLCSSAINNGYVSLYQINNNIFCSNCYALSDMGREAFKYIGESDDNDYGLVDSDGVSVVTDIRGNSNPAALTDTNLARAYVLNDVVNHIKSPYHLAFVGDKPELSLPYAISVTGNPIFFAAIFDKNEAVSGYVWENILKLLYDASHLTKDNEPFMPWFVFVVEKREDIERITSFIKAQDDPGLNSLTDEFMVFHILNENRIVESAHPDRECYYDFRSHSFIHIADDDNETENGTSGAKIFSTSRFLNNRSIPSASRILSFAKQNVLLALAMLNYLPVHGFLSLSDLYKLAWLLSDDVCRGYTPSHLLKEVEEAESRGYIASYEYNGNRYIGCTQLWDEIIQNSQTRYALQSFVHASSNKMNAMVSRCPVIATPVFSRSTFENLTCSGHVKMLISMITFGYPKMNQLFDRHGVIADQGLHYFHINNKTYTKKEVNLLVSDREHFDEYVTLSLSFGFHGVVGAGEEFPPIGKENTCGLLGWFAPDGFYGFNRDTNTWSVLFEQDLTNLFREWHVEVFEDEETMDSEPDRRALFGDVSDSLDNEEDIETEDFSMASAEEQDATAPASVESYTDTDTLIELDNRFDAVVFDTVDSEERNESGNDAAYVAEVAPEADVPEASADGTKKTVITNVNEEPVVLEADTVLFNKADWDKLSVREVAGVLADEFEGKNAKAFAYLTERLIGEGSVLYEPSMVEDCVAESILLYKALSMEDDRYASDLMRLTLASASSLVEHRYTGDVVYDAFENISGDLNMPVLKLLAVMNALFYHTGSYDYALRSYANSLFEYFDDTFEGLAFVKPLFNQFLRMEDTLGSGFTPSVLHAIDSITADKQYEARLVATAKELLHMPHISSGLTKSLPRFLSLCFGNGSDFAVYLQSIIDRDAGMLPKCREFFTAFTGDSEEEFEVSDTAVEAYLDALWGKTLEDVLGPSELLPTIKRKCHEAIRERAVLIGNWLEIHSDKYSNTQIEKAGRVKSDILDTIASVKATLEASADGMSADMAFAVQMLRYAVYGWESVLNGIPARNEYLTFLRTDALCLDEQGIPVMDDVTFSMEGFEAWRNMLRHISIPAIDLNECLTRISDPGMPYMFDNYGQAILLESYLRNVSTSDPSLDTYREDATYARNAALTEMDRFRGVLETYFAYGRISEHLKEEISEEMAVGFQTIDEHQCYGLLRRLIDCLKVRMDRSSETVMERLMADIELRLSQCVNDRQRELLNKARVRASAPHYNMVSAEEYINRYDANLLDDTLSPDDPEMSVFIDFVDNEYAKLYQVCQKNASGAIRGFGLDYVNAYLEEKKVAAQYRTSSRNLLTNIPNTPSEVLSEKFAMRTLLTELGFTTDELSVKQIISSNGNASVYCAMNVCAEPKNRAEYAHPVDMFGTKLRSPLDVVFMFGRLQANDIVDRVTRLNIRRTAIVLVNGCIDLATRRQVAEKFHRDTSGQCPFLLVDWVLLLHLACLPRNERLAALLNCTLPFSASFQPFVIKGPVSDEMFIGRKSELNAITDPNGPCVVYGGRQLGKTALLERALSLCNNPSRREYAVLVRASLFSSEQELVPAIVNALEQDGLMLRKKHNVHTMSDLCALLRKEYNASSWSKLHLFIDEADHLLSEFSKLEPAYKPIIPLADLMHDTGNDFKFVLAGLHNVYRAATDPNTVFGQLGDPLCIKPLAQADALELLSKPLRYLGFRFKPEQLENIIINTNRYPGIIHHVGYNLVNNLYSHYTQYYQASHGEPPYDITEQQLGEIMSGNDINTQINQLLRWTLEADSGYFTLARIVAYLYYERPECNKNGYSIDMIAEYAQLLDAPDVCDMDTANLTALLNELVEMGILVSTGNRAYRLRQRRFLEVIGASCAEIENDLHSTGKEVR